MNHPNMPDLDIDTASHTGARIRGYSVERVQALMARIATLEEEQAAIGAGGVSPLRKPTTGQRMVPLADVLARLEQGFGAGSAPVTTLQHHFAEAEAPAT